MALIMMMMMVVMAMMMAIMLMKSVRKVTARKELGQRWGADCHQILSLAMK